MFKLIIPRCLFSVLRRTQAGIARKTLEDGMSLRYKLRKGRVAVGLLIALAVIVISSPALAQSDSNPKYDIFVGYQWLHPGATVPAPGSNPNNPSPFTLPDLAKGAGVAFTYNFDPHWGGEVDYGSNGDNNVV